MCSSFNKKIKSNKGFSLVEMLAAVTILGILSVMAINGIQMILNKSNQEFYSEQENNMILATQTFFQNNRNELPKKIGGRKKIYLKDLIASKYIDPIKDKNKKECDMEASYVEVFKFSQTSYKYKVKLVCPGEHETEINNSEIEPVIEIDLPTTKDFLFGSLYDYLIKNNILFSRFEEELEAIMPNKEWKDRLKLEKDVAILKRIRRGYDVNNKLIEYTINYYDASLYKYKVEVAQIEKVK